MSLSTATAGRTWEGAAAPAAVRLARSFETAWRASDDQRPDLDDYLPRDDDCPGARLALLRADLALRWEAGEKAGAGRYRDRYPDLDDETFVALIYEEFCLREDDHDDPDPSEYVDRYPAVASRLRRVLDIHGLLGAASTAVTSESGGLAPASPFPEVGQTIAGFYLVEELGRGAFARVFLARERQLADRPVALKVARAGSREPQTLARLQHTHIVPVHSYRTDPATGLHLLCMPYFGRLTLARVLADPRARVSRSGADLVSVLDRLGLDDGPAPVRAAGRTALQTRSYAQAMAWWVARMAEALAHAHDRGVLHRDVKPSNVLVASDGMPMLLDFNLARAAVSDDPEHAPEALGGTLDYMSPEHLDELADGVPGRVDARSDIFGLGVLLYEALIGSRPFAPPVGALSASEVLRLAAADRRGGAPWLRETNPEVPAALEAIVRQCLAADPADRFAGAADLAADLQAVADDQPLKFAREPWPSRVARRLRRHRRGLVVLVPVVAALAAASVFLVRDQTVKLRLWYEAKQLYDEGERSFQRGDHARALIQFESAARLAEQPAPETVRGPAGAATDLEELKRQARRQFRLAEQFARAHHDAEALVAAGGPLRFRLLGLGGAATTATRDLQEILKPFYVLARNDDWTTLDTMTRLDPATRARVLAEVNELLFLMALALERAGDHATVVGVCDRALLGAARPAPWHALRAATIAPDPDSETDALACFEWGLLREHEGRADATRAWLRRSLRLEPNNAWRHACLALVEDRAGRRDAALSEADIAVALLPGSPWPRVCRARIERDRGDRASALDDIQHALRAFERNPGASDPAFVRELRREQEPLHD